MTTRRSPSIWLLRGLVYSIGVFVSATAILWALQTAYPNYGRDPTVTYDFGLYLSPFGQWAIITFLLTLLATALAGAAALRRSIRHGRTRWARTFAILLVVSLLAPVMYIVMIYGRLPQLVNGAQVGIISIISALAFLALAILTLVYAHLRDPGPNDVLRALVYIVFVLLALTVVLIGLWLAFPTWGANPGQVYFFYVAPQAYAAAGTLALAAILSLTTCLAGAIFALVRRHAGWALIFLGTAIVAVQGPIILTDANAAFSSVSLGGQDQVTIGFASIAAFLAMPVLALVYARHANS